MHERAIVRAPGANFADGLTTVRLGAPILEKALEQHERYCEALELAGLTLTRLEPEPRFPDSTFVEDAAILSDRCAILARPGAASRRGEPALLRPVVESFFRDIREIAPPGTLDGGDVCRAGDRFFIGLSGRTNEEGARQLASILARERYDSSVVDIKGLAGVLHLKSGIADLGNNRLAAIKELASLDAFENYEIILLDPGERYAANCIHVNGHVLLAAGYPAFASAVRDAGYRVIELDMSEFRKMDGGLSCLSLRF